MRLEQYLFNVFIAQDTSVLPVVTAIDDEPVKMHWLFCALPLLGVIAVAGMAPESVSSASILRAIVNYGAA